MAVGLVELEKGTTIETEETDITNDVKVIDISIYHPKDDIPSYDLLFYSLKDSEIGDITVKFQGERLSLEEITLAKEKAEENIKKLSLAIRDFYNKKNDVRNSIRFFNPSLSTFERVILEEPDKNVKDFAYKALWFYSMRMGIEPAPLEFYYRKIKAIEKKALKEEAARDLKRAFVKAVRETELEQAQKLQQLQQLQKERAKQAQQKAQLQPVQATPEPALTQTVTPKIIQPREYKVTKPVKSVKPEVKVIKLRKKLMQPKFLSPSFEFRNVGMPVSAALLLYIGAEGAFKGYMEYMKHRMNKLQETAFDFRTIGKINQIAKNLEGRIFYSTKVDSSIITPGEHNLLAMVDYAGERKRIEDALASVSFSVREMKLPFSPPLENCNGGEDFGKTNRKLRRYKKKQIQRDTMIVDTLIRADMVLRGPHSGGDFNGGDIIKAIAQGYVETGWGDIGGYFIRIKHGTVKAMKGGLEFDLINGEKFIFYTDSIKCIVNERLTYRPPEFFDKKNVYSYYCHIASNKKNRKTGAFLVNSGSYVKRGDKIAIKGATGRTSGDPHLHLMVVLGDIPVDPFPLISSDENERSNMAELYVAKDSIAKLLDYRMDLSKF